MCSKVYVVLWFVRSYEVKLMIFRNAEDAIEEAGKHSYAMVRTQDVL